MSKSELELKMEQNREKRRLQAEEREREQRELLDSLKSDAKDDQGYLKTALTPVKRTKNLFSDCPKWKELIWTFKKAKDLNYKLLSVVLASVFLEHKPAFLLSEGILVDLLEKNIFIKRKTISGSEFRFFMLFLFKSGYVKIEVEPKDRKHARLFSLDGRLLEAYGIYAFNNPEDVIRGIVEDYLHTEALKTKRNGGVDEESVSSINEVVESKPIASNSNVDDLEIVSKVMNLSHKFGDYENKNFYKIAELVRKFGSFKGDQKKLFVNFIKDKTWPGSQ